MMIPFFKHIVLLCLLGNMLPTEAKLSTYSIKDIDEKDVTSGKRKAQPYSTHLCSVSALVQCFITNTTTSCDDIGVQPHNTCGPKSLTMIYKYCNINDASEDDEGSIIQLKKNPSGEAGTIAMYRQQWGRPALSLHTLAPGECETASVIEEVDTCRNKIVAELKLEGWVENRVEQDGYYCYAWDFLEVKFLKGKPIPEEPASPSQKVMCDGRPDGMKFKIKPTSCDDSVNGLKGFGQRQRKLKSDNGNGFTCSGNSPTGEVVMVKISSSSSNNGDGILYKEVVIGKEYEFNGKVSSNTMVEITDTNHDERQSIQFHSSCSKPIYTGDTFGSFVITEFLYD